MFFDFQGEGENLSLPTPQTAPMHTYNKYIHTPIHTHKIMHTLHTYPYTFYTYMHVVTTFTFDL